MGRYTDLTEAAVRRLARTRSFGLGENYYEQNAVRDVASAHDDNETAREAAVAAFKTEPSVATYRAAREVAGDDWRTIRDEFLEYLQRRSPGRETAREYAEIFLAEDIIDEAIDIAVESGHYTIVEPVVEAVWDDRPEWTIAACKNQVEPIIEEGQSDQYRHAVRWLRHAGKAAQVGGELEAWLDYVETLRDDHYRKYKLRPMLEELLDEFRVWVSWRRIYRIDGWVKSGVIP